MDWEITKRHNIGFVSFIMELYTLILHYDVGI